MTAVQLSSWRSAPGLPDGEALPDARAVARSWERAVMVPPSERHTVWVALAASTVVGLACLAPATDPDLDPVVTTELLLLTVDPAHRSQGHGSRLLAATMESLVGTEQVTAVTWVNAQDDSSRQFLQGAGWGIDGAHRSLAQHDDDPPASSLRQLRFGTDLSPSEKAEHR